MRPAVLCFPLALALVPAALAEPPRGPWAGYKPGSFVKTKTVTVVKVGAHKIETVTEITQTLIDVKGDRGVVETVANMNGVPRATKTRSDVALKQPLPPPAGARRKTGRESLTVAGRTLQCDWIESENDMAGNRTTVRTWTSPNVPGGVAKTVSRNELMESTLEIVAFEAK